MWASMATQLTQNPVTVSLLRRNQTHPRKWASSSLTFTCSASSTSSSSSQEQPRMLILYSKQGCCLCDGLKEKLHAAISLSSPSHSLHDIDLQIRDITTNPEWERAYQYEIPVLAKLRPDGSQEILPRLSPRLSVELIHKKIADAFRQ